MVSIFQLPVEILIKIFKYMDFIDIIQMCEVFNDAKEIFTALKIRSLHIQANNYNFHEKHLKSDYIRTQNLMYITYLNINSLYWISARHLRIFLGYMRNLESLYILDTKLSVAAADLLTYNKLSKLKNLALTVTVFNVDVMKQLPPVRKLCMQLFIDDIITIQLLDHVVQPNLIEFMIILLPDVSYYIMPFTILIKNVCMQPLHLCEFANAIVPFARYRLVDVDPMPRISKFMYDNIREHCLCSGQDSRDKEAILFERMNLVDERSRIISVAQCELNALEYLMKYLNKWKVFNGLKIRSCDLYYHFGNRKYEEEEYKIFEMFENIEHFTATGLRVGFRGNFILNAFRSWRFLKTIDFTLCHHNVPCYNNLFAGIKHLNYLTDLRLHMIYIPFNHFFDQFPHIKTMRRLSLDGSIEEVLNISCFTKFLNTNTHILFMGINIKDTTIKTVLQCTRIMANFAKDDRRKIYLFTNRNINKTPVSKMPLIHNVDMINTELKSYKHIYFPEFDEWEPETE